MKMSIVVNGNELKRFEELLTWLVTHLHFNERANSYSLNVRNLQQ